MEESDVVNPSLQSKMEETEATPTQFSSLDVVEERLSKLPEHIIHYILRFLPCVKDVVRTSLISKSWFQAWSTFPIEEFNLEDFVPRSSSLSDEEIEAKRKQFIRFVDSSLQRFGKQSRDGNGDGMKSFNLFTDYKMASQANRWVGMALDNKVEHLALCLRISFMDSSQHRCLLPDRVLSAYWLNSLILVGPTICIPLTEASSVDLSSLTFLKIQSSTIPDEQLQKLLSGCPALENIALLDCNSLSKVDIFHHPNLKTLEVTVGSWGANLTAISVRAPKLIAFSYNCECLYERNVVVKIHCSPELKHLRICDGNKTDKWFHKFIVQFPLIENLTIESCVALRKIRISNPLLEAIKIAGCKNLEDVVINSKKLAYFVLYTPQTSIPNPSIRMEMDNPPNDCTAILYTPIMCELLMEASWYCKLKEFLTRASTFKSLAIVLQAVSPLDGDMKEKDVHKKLPPAACNVEMLELAVIGAQSSCYSHILNGLLSTCHPTSIMLNVVDSDYQFIKLVCKELRNREKKRNCCCKDGFKCWKHQLKEVKIEKIKGIKLEEDLDWDALFELLPTLGHGNRIYFKLIW